MKRLWFALIALILLITACTTPAQPAKLRVMTEEYPPFNYTDAGGNLVGSSTEAVKGIINKLGENITIEVLPWARAYETVLSEPDAALYSMARTPERENVFMWVGPIGSYENWLYVKKGSNIRVSSLDEAKAVKSIAVVKDEAGQQELAQQGFINFVYTDSTADGLKKLAAGEVDLWLGTGTDVELVAKQAGVDPAEIEAVVFVHKVDLYIAFNKNTPYANVLAWQNA
ncbi:MAG: transporter substrate-binding domain-containing protein, partial [Dehalococcoidia bacterium]|nr:transporter substrate-binding domain-containing protein [Dehalococcoidia bacterium]